MARPTDPIRARHWFATPSVLAICAAIAILPATAAAQDPSEPDQDPPAHVSFVDGSAVLERDGRPDNAPANMPLLAGDRVRTQNGRVEILYSDGSTLHLDTNTTVDFQSDDLVRLLDGRIRLTIAGQARDVSYRIDAPGAWADITQPGEYRLSVLRGFRARAEGTSADNVEVELAVLRGTAELVNEGGRTPVRAGERAFARTGAAPSYAYVFNSATWDAFDRWSEDRRGYRVGLSTQYLPDQVRPYTRTFDTYGTWRHEPTYGYVWYPTVQVGWRPYYYGRWASLRPWGWTWIGSDPWAWATHHYGRWGFSAGVWFWIPGRRWGPAWVSWAYSPGYVSWCPLGWDNRPIFQIVNVYTRGYDPWRAWTVIPRRHFGYGVVHANVVPRHVIDTRLRGTFVHRATGPEVVGYAVPRATAPIRVAGTRRDPGSRRGDATVYTNLNPDQSRVRTPGARVTVDPAAGTSPPRAVPRSAAGAPAGGGSVPRADVGPRAVPRERAAPRGSGRDIPRTEPAAPAVRAFPRDARGSGADDRPARRAVPRSTAPDAPPPAVQPDSRGDVPSYRRAPSGSWRVPDSSMDRTDPRESARPRERAIERSAPPSYGAPAMRAPDRSIDRSAPPSYDPPRAPERAIERGGPPRSYGPPPESRAVPRSEPPPSPGPAPERAAPHRGGADRPAPRMDPPSGHGMRAVPRAEPRGGSGGGGGGVRRR